MFETLFGGLMGGIFRIAPEILKWLDRKNERAHELAMLQAEMDFAKIKGEIAFRQTEADMTVAELDAMKEAYKEQSATAQAAGWLVSAFSALIRPTVTTWFVALYSAVKLTSMYVAYSVGADWKEVLITSWTNDDMSILMMILTFWFVGRVWERNNK